jgi:small subunit ribosomal protein S6
MFLFDPTFGTSFENCEKEIHRLMERAQAEVLLCRRWDERRLAFKIKGRKRGVYVLVYFQAPPDNIAPLERDVRLSESILRVLILSAEGMSREHMEGMAACCPEAMPRTAEDADERGGGHGEGTGRRRHYDTSETRQAEGPRAEAAVAKAVDSQES